MAVNYNIDFIPVAGSVTKIEYRKENELDWIAPDIPDNPTGLSTYPLTLEDGSRYYVRVTAIAKDGKCTNRSRIILVDTSIITGTTTTTSTTTTTTTLPPNCPNILDIHGEFVGGQLIAYWGWKDTNTVLSSSAIRSSANSQAVLVHQSITCDFAGAIVPKYLWMAEPQQVDAKTKWQDIFQLSNNGSIGTDQDLFNAPTISGNFRFYITEYKTEQVNPIQFRVS